MTMLLAELQSLASNPWAWGVVAILAIVSGYSVVQFVACPYAAGRATISDGAMAEAQSQSYAPGARFALAMVGGAGLIIAGLFMIANGIRPAIALAALVTGIMLIQTEPVRLAIREQVYKVIAHRDASPEQNEIVRDRLRGSQRNLAITSVGLLVGVVAAMLAFAG